MKKWVVIIVLLLPLSAISQNDSAAYRFRTGINIFHAAFNTTFESNFDYFITEHLFASLKGGYTLGKAHRYINVERSHVFGSFIKAGVNYRIALFDDLFIYSGIHGGFSEFTHRFTIQIPYFYGTYTSSHEVKGGSSSFNIPFGIMGIIYPNIHLDMGAALTFANPRNDALAPDKYFLPGYGSVTSASYKQGEQFAKIISPFFTVSFCF